MSKSAWAPKSGKLVDAGEPFEEDAFEDSPVESIKSKCEHRGQQLLGVPTLMGSSYRSGLKIPGNSATVILTPEALQLAFPSGWSSGRSPRFNSHLRGRLVYWPWRDMHVPDEDWSVVVSRFVELHEEHERGRTIEVACHGGHGRTGTVLAVLAAMHANWPADFAVEMLRQAYCERAIETREQEEFVVRVLREVRGG